MAKTRTTTFRIDESNDMELRKIAEENQTSTNTLVNQILKDYVSIERPMKQYGTITSSTDLFLELVSNLSVKSLEEVGSKMGGKEPKEFIQFRWNTVTRGTVLEFLQIYFTHCGYGVPDIRTDNEKISIIVNHGLGEKFSIYLKSFLSAMFESTLKSSCEFNSRKNMLMCIVAEK